MLRDLLLRRAAVFLEEACAGLGIHGGARLEDIHHDEAERHRDRHVQEKQGKGADRERAELPQALELRDAHGERGEHERDDDEEQHAQEDLPERVQHVGRECPGRLQEARERTAEREGRAAGGRPDQQAPEDPVRKPVVDVRRHVPTPRHRPAPQW